MKKLFILALCGLFALSACDRKKNVQPVEPQADTTEVVAALNVEHAIATDKEEMYAQYNKDYRWFETSVVYKDFLDEETTGEVEEILNVFQTVEKISETCYDVYVVQFNYTADGRVTQVIHSFWIEDSPLRDGDVNITFDEAFQKLMEANLPKPHSRHCVLRKEVGSKEANAQYVFGNTMETVYVDAVTGEVRDYDPAFGPELAKPLGEWP